jgi:uncharacterized OB-fold protein
MDLPIKKDLFHIPSKSNEKPYLLGSRCRVCGYTCFPRKEVCVSCLRDDTMDHIELGQKGTLEAFAVMRVGTPEFPAPYIIGYVRTAEGALVFCSITKCEPREDALEIGQEMELVIEKVKEDAQGNSLVGWKYRPVEKRGLL